LTGKRANFCCVTKKTILVFFPKSSKEIKEIRRDSVPFYYRMQPRLSVGEGKDQRSHDRFALFALFSVILCSVPKRENAAPQIRTKQREKTRQQYA
jgi:hypothetical protein